MRTMVLKGVSNETLAFIGRSAEKHGTSVNEEAIGLLSRYLAKIQKEKQRELDERANLEKALKELKKLEKSERKRKVPRWQI